MANSPLDQSDLNNENVFNEEWGKLVNKLFGNKTTITKSEIERTMRKNKINPNNAKGQNEKVFDSTFTWGNVLNAFDDKDEVTVDELYKSISDQKGINNEDKPSEQRNTNNENVFDEEWEKLVNKLFGNKKTITKREIKRIMRKNKINPNNAKGQNEKVFDSIFTWGSILNAFENKNKITIDELYKSISGQQDTPSEQQNTPSEQQDTPSEQQDTPSEQQDTPSEQQDTPSEQQDTPSEQQDTPSEQQDTPSEQQDTPSEQQDTPSEQQDTPSEQQDTPSNQSELNNENVFNEEFEKLANYIFEDKEEIKADDISTKLKEIYPNYYEMDLDTVNAFNTKFTWANILRAINSREGFISKTEFRDELKKQF